jgi:hypothetical protein
VLHVEAVTRSGDRLYLKARQQVRPGDTVAVTVAPERALVFPEPDEEGTP